MDEISSATGNSRNDIPVCPEHAQRLRVLRLRPEEALLLLRPPTHGERYQVPDVQGIPAGCEPVRAGYDLEWDAFVFVLRHPSFDAVLPGNPTPRLQLPYVAKSAAHREAEQALLEKAELAYREAKARHEAACAATRETWDEVQRASHTLNRALSVFHAPEVRA